MARASRKRRKITRVNSQEKKRFQTDPCKTPAQPAPAIPIPYPNIAKSSDTSKGSKKVKTNGKMTSLKGSTFRTSSGDEEGTTRSPLRSVRKRSRLRRKTE